MNSRFDLHGLTHERLVDVVREGVGSHADGPRSDVSPSLYRRNPEVPALTIRPYPRRRARSADPAQRALLPTGLDNPTYQDFLVSTPAPVTEDLETA